MSNQAQTFWMLSILSAAFALRSQSQLDDARETFAAVCPDDAAALVIDTTAEIVEVAQ